ncbi:MAG: class I SAM-dependent methyltransferase [Natronosporangium sp.]
MPAPEDLPRLRRYWDKHARSYDKQMGFWERRLFADTREWICRQAAGDVLEVAIGTGLNLGHYPDHARLTGIDLSPQMLALARSRADQLGRPVQLREGDAQQLDFPDASFGTVVCTFSLCAIPDDRRAVAEMVRVLRPGGTLLLADHVVSTAGPVRLLQRLLEQVTIPLGEEHFRRRPIRHVRDQGLVIERHERFKLGIVERLAAGKAER